VSNEPTFIKFEDIRMYEPALSVGGLRHLRFKMKKELEENGVTVNFGRRLLINLPKLREWLILGNARKIPE
jgi:hypothetical protein